MKIVSLARVNFLISCLLFSTCIIAIDHGVKTRVDNKYELSKPELRGATVYKNYCIFCHGEKGDGNAELTKIYRNSNLSIYQKSKDYYEKIIRNGSMRQDQLPYMPMFNDMLSNEQITDVVTYLTNLKNDIKRGYAVYKTNCILCHGVKGNGKGKVSALFNPPPADLRQSDKNEDYLEKIIRLGGEAVGRSPDMPVWNGQLSNQEIKDVIQYLTAIKLKISLTK